MLIDGIVGLLHHKENFKGRKLDIAYITPQLIASAMPTDAFFQSYYRMNASVLVKYLNQNHGNSWHIWNLQENHELGYDPGNIGGSGKTTAVSRFPIPDHRPIPFLTLIRAVAEIREFVAKNSKNVALVHCKCGKGRTGTVVVAYLMLFHAMSYERATKEFTMKRIRLGVVEGITIKSQQRYLRYLDRWIQGNQAPSYLEPLNNIKIVQLIIRNPKVDDFDLDLGELADGTQKSPSERMQWDVTFKEKYYVLRPLGSDINGKLPADLWLSFTGYQRKGGYRVPKCVVNYAFNVIFEPNELQNIHPDFEQCVPPLSSKASISPSVLSASNASNGSCIYQWDESDGIYGLDLRGFKAFDSIEIIWKKVDEEIPEPPSVDCFEPPSISTPPH